MPFAFGLLVISAATGVAAKHLANSRQKNRAKKLRSSLSKRQTTKSLVTEKPIQRTEKTPCCSKTIEAIDKNLKLTTAMLGVAILGATVFHPLTSVALIGLAWTCKDIYKTAYHKLRNGKVGIEVLDTIASISLIYLGYAVLGAIGSIFYFISKRLLLKTEDHSIKQLVNIFGELPQTAWIIVDDVEIEIPFDELKTDDTVSIHTGNMIPIDGTVTYGYALIDQQTLTGESQPVEKKVGDRCFASTVVLEGKVHIRVEKMGDETVTAEIGKILHNSIDFKDTMISKGQNLADKSTLPLLALGTVSLPILGISGSTAILNSSFGYSLRLVSPMLMLNFLTIASNNGVLIKDGRSLEFLNNINTVVFDKTGTLTLNQPHVANIHTLGRLSAEQLLIYAASAEYRQTHPIALALLQHAKNKKLDLLPIDKTRYEVGYGLGVKLDNKNFYIGSCKFMEMEQITIPDHIQKLTQKGQQSGYSFVYLAIEQQLAGVIELHPTVRPEAKQIISTLKARNIACLIISGDHQSSTAHLAQKLGIEQYFAEVLPQEKAALIEDLQKKGKKVCFVGDGINDSIALKKADVSISLKGASTIATDTAQIVLMNESLEQLPLIFDLGKEFETYMSRNIMSAVIPSALIVSGAFFFHFGIAAATVMNQLGLMAGMGNSASPLLKFSKTSTQQSSPSSKAK